MAEQETGIPDPRDLLGRLSSQRMRERSAEIVRDRAAARADAGDPVGAAHQMALMDLYLYAEHPYPDVEETWRDMSKWRPPLTMADAPFSSPAAMCAGD